MTVTNVTPATMAREALCAMSEPQRLAFATKIITEASSPHSVLQLRRAASAATVTADGLERAAFVEREMRTYEGGLSHGFIDPTAAHEQAGRVRMARMSAGQNISDLPNVSTQNSGLTGQAPCIGGDSLNLDVADRSFNGMRIGGDDV